MLEVRFGGKNPDYADVRFIAGDGQTVTAEVEVSAANPTPQVGDEMNVVFDPNDPAEDVAVTEVHQVFYWLDVLVWVPILGVSLGWIPLWVGAVEANRRRSRGKLYQTEQ